MSENQTPKLVNLYLSHIPHCKFVFSDGGYAIFTGGRYTTDNESKISQLDYAIKMGNPTIYVDPAAKQINAALLNPMEVMKRKIIAEFLEEQRIAAATLNPSRDMGSTQRLDTLAVASSKTIAPVAAGGNAASTFVPASLMPGGIPASLASALGLGAEQATNAPITNKEEAETQLSLQALVNTFSDPAGQPSAVTK